MAWYYGTYSCGHEGRVNVVGKMSERQWKIDKHFSGICPDCVAKEREERFKQAAEAAKEYEFPELSGTPKQVSWAMTLRAAFYDLWDRKKKDVSDIISGETTARFWIDNRDMLNMPGFIINYRKQKEREQVQQQITNIDAVKPSEIKHDGVVEIVERNGCICVKYERNSEFTDVVKSLYYSWDGTMWSRTLSETTGSFADRAAEVGHELLRHGFAISIHDKDILGKAVYGDFEPECTRWIYSRKNSSLLAIRWEGYNRRLYDRARRIKGSSWDNPNVLVDVCHYKDILKFADEEGFRFTVKAEQKIKDYIEQMSKVRTV